MNYVIGILMVAATIAIVWFIVTRTKKKRVERKVESVLSNLSVPNIPLHWAQSEQTPKGLHVYWNGTVFNTPQEKEYAFKCFDVGFENMFNSMAARFPTWDFNPSLFVIGIVEPTAKAEDGYEALIDKFGRKIGGTVIGTGDGYNRVMIIIPSQKANGWSFGDFQMRIVWHEGEHDIEYRSDSKVFLEKSGTVPEFGPDIHPHWPLEGVAEIPAPSNGARGLMAHRKARILCGCGRG